MFCLPPTCNWCACVRVWQRLQTTSYITVNRVCCRAGRQGRSGEPHAGGRREVSALDMSYRHPYGLQQKASCMVVLENRRMLCEPLIRGSSQCRERGKGGKSTHVRQTVLALPHAACVSSVLRKSFAEGVMVVLVGKQLTPSAAAAPPTHA